HCMISCECTSHCNKASVKTIVIVKCIVLKCCGREKGGCRLRLQEILDQLTFARVVGTVDVEISGVAMNSQYVKPGDIFICIPGIPGFQVDRHPFAEEAVQAGAAAIVAEREVN